MSFYMIEGNDEVQETAPGARLYIFRSRKRSMTGIRPSRPRKHGLGRSNTSERLAVLASLDLLSPRRRNVGNGDLHLGCDLSESGAGK
jgi:hypothetical protein